MTNATATPATGNTTQGGQKTAWTIDPAHSHVGFSIKHLMIATVRGSFTQVQGVVRVDESDPTTAEVDITIPTASVTTGEEKRDGHLRSADFFDVERFPNMTFRSKRVERKSGDSFRVVGDLTIRDVTRPVVWDVTATADGANVSGTAQYNFVFSEWGIPVPRVARVASISEPIILEIDFRGTNSAS